MSLIFPVAVCVLILYECVSSNLNVNNFEKITDNQNRSFGNGNFMMRTNSALTCSLTCARLSQCVAIQIDKELALCELVNVTDASTTRFELFDSAGLNQSFSVELWTYSYLVAAYSVSGYACGPEWQLFGGSCYLVVHIYRIFTKAKQNCQDLGGHLVYIKTDEVQQFLKQTLLNNGSISDTFWIGLVADAGSENHTWLDSDPLSTGKNWYSNNPDNITDECVQLVVDWNYLWNDVDCNGLELKSICEI